MVQYFLCMLYRFIPSVPGVLGTAQARCAHRSHTQVCGTWYPSTIDTVLHVHESWFNRVVYLRVPESRTTYLIKVERHRTFVYTMVLCACRRVHPYTRTPYLGILCQAGLEAGTCLSFCLRTHRPLTPKPEKHDQHRGKCR